MVYNEDSRFQVSTSRWPCKLVARRRDTVGRVLVGSREGSTDLVLSRGTGLVPASGIPGHALGPAILLWIQWATLMGFK